MPRGVPNESNDEQALLKKVLEELKEKNPGDPKSVLGAIDTCAERIKLRRHLGKDLGSILATEVKKKEKDPIVALELGTLCGYSAIIIASAMENDTSMLCSLDTNMKTTGDVKKIVNCAGISAEVRVLDATSKTSAISSKVTQIKGRLIDVPTKLKDLLDKMGAPYFDFIFMNHSINDYGPDFGLLIEKGLVGKGTVIVANTKEFPAAPDNTKYFDEHIPKDSKIKITLAETTRRNEMTVFTVV